jgi:hypothetical protein
VSVQDRCTICAKHTIGLEIVLDARFASNVLQAQKSFWMHPMELQGDKAQVESRFGPFGDSVSVSAR